MIVNWIHAVRIIGIVRSSITSIWSIYRRYGHNTLEILFYYMINNRVIYSHSGYMRSVLQMQYDYQLEVQGHNTFEILLYYMVNNRVVWSYIGYMRSVLQIYYGHELGMHGQYTGDMVIILLKYYRILLSIIESYGHGHDILEILF